MRSASEIHFQCSRVWLTLLFQPQTSLESSRIKRQREINITMVACNQPHQTTLLPPNTARSQALIGRSSAKRPKSFLGTKCVFVTHNGIEIKLQIDGRTDWREIFAFLPKVFPWTFPSGPKSHEELEGSRNVNTVGRHLEKEKSK